ncbi:MAG: sigma-54 dependent transcriptional regulator [Sorangiineae bacterium]|nr:sigma-54 dependent transcriptional regulator [Polyangiaceae bacterium]MEB2324270.1 sigma-54 dependent transcriptional regulator [Sorangiineae bacterium]
MQSVPPPPPRLLVADDEPGLRQMLEILFRRAGYEVVVVPGCRAALEALAESPSPFAVVLTDLMMPDGSGLDVLAGAKQRSAATEVILLTAHSTVENAIGAMRSGAYDFVTKPFAPDQLTALIDKAFEKHAVVSENERLRAKFARELASDLVTRSPAMRAVDELVTRIAPTRATVLVTGESGTGKERIARTIHERSERAGGPFRVVNCGALPEALMESELFGHEKGAFTGAASRHAGLFRDAEGGTLLLDEVGELPASLQVKLLRVLQERAVRPVGGTRELPIDVRVIAATNRDVEADVASGAFRQDLYYRLNVIRVALPALAERREDIPVLAERFVQRFARELGKDVTGLTPDALRALERYPFPGNVRELENLLERAVALAGSRAIGLGDLPPEVSGASGGTGPSLVELPPGGCDLDEVLGEVERRLLVEALGRTGGVRKTAAALLRIPYRSLRYRLAKHALDASDALDAGDGDDEPESS